MIPWLIAILGSLSALGTAVGSGGPPIFVVGLIGAVLSGMAARLGRHSSIEASLWVVVWSVGWAATALASQLPTLHESLGIVSLPGVLLALPLYALALFLVGWAAGVAPWFLCRPRQESQANSLE
jgi:hypothetical protein